MNSMSNLFYYKKTTLQNSIWWVKKSISYNEKNPKHLGGLANEVTTWIYYEI